MKNPSMTQLLKTFPFYADTTDIKKSSINIDQLKCKR